MFIKKIERQKKSRGFTLVELLVATGIFTVIAVFATGALIIVFESNRKSNSVQTLMTNLNSGLENMSREIRFGETYHCGAAGALTQPRDCILGDDFISFEFEGEQISYRRNGNTIERRIGMGGSWSEYISGNIEVETLKFYVSGTNTSDNLQPRVTVVFAGQAGGPTAQGGSSFVIQNTLTQRKEDI